MNKDHIQDRFIERTHERAGDLVKKFSSLNFRSHPDRQRAIVEGSLDTLGYIGEVKASRRVDEMFDGHLRVKIALEKLGPDALIPVNWYDLDEDETRQALLLHDTTTGMADIDFEMFNELVEMTPIELPEWGEFLTEFMAEMGQNGAGGPGGDTAPQVGKAAKLKERWGTELGQCWELGQHRLVIGDCTDKAVVEAVAFGESIDFIYVDPPYSVSYADKNKSLNAVAFGNRIQIPMENDHLSTEEAAQGIWLPSFRNLYDIAKPGCVYYCSAPQGGDQMMMMMMMLCDAGWLVKHELIWVKNNHVLGRADYQYKHEPIIYGWKPGAGHYFIESRSEVSTWEIDKPTNSDLHPTEKPLALIERAMNNSSKRGDIIADFFVGSGTTIIAAENLGREARCIELDAGYAAVSIQRWFEATGLEPRRVNG